MASPLMCKITTNLQDWL